MKNKLVTIASVCSFVFTSLSLHAVDAEPAYPPAMSQREIGPIGALPGQTNVLQDGEYEFILFVPSKWKAPASGQVDLRINFHGATWFAIQEHLRGGLNHPMIAFHGGDGSGKYQRPFKDTLRFGRWMKIVEDKLKEGGSPASTKITAVSISSYGAGYAAIREILQSAEYQKLIKRVVIAGAIYADYAKDADGSDTKTPINSQIDPYIPFAQAATLGEKTFVITYSEVLPGPYAGSSECAEAISSKVGGTFAEVELDSSAAANDPDFPLIKRCDVKSFHLWGYAGNTPESHITHARHIADVWRALDDAKNP